jgi:beta-xylosidase
MRRLSLLLSFSLLFAGCESAMHPDNMPSAASNAPATRPTIPPGVTGLPAVARYPWTPDLGNGSYKNPILFADYSDPDVCRVGDDYYLTASSFSCIPGLPILHSTDLVNWTIIGYAIEHYPVAAFKEPQHGGGVWAPAIRYHKGEFYIYYGDPDHGIFMTKAKNPAGPWEPLHLVAPTRGWIDTCPFWDDDGNAYLVHAFANSRAGIANILWLNKLAPDGKSLLDDGHLVFDARGKYTTVEGPKMYKRNGFYYIFAPGGGVAAGYQIAFRSKNIDGPYDSRIVMDSGKTKINGPHQGGWVDTPDGKENWFVHFQEVLPYGRLVHLQPMRWVDDWPVMGETAAGAAKGQPVLTHRKPATGSRSAIAVPQTSDDFGGGKLGLQWQWWSDYEDSWYSVSARAGFLRLNAVPLAAPTVLYNRANLLLQKFPAETFTVTARIDASGLGRGERAGLVLAGRTTAALQLEKSEGGGLRVIRSDFAFRAASTAPAGGRGRGRGLAAGRGASSQPAAARGPRRFDAPPYGPIPRITIQPTYTPPAARPAPLPRETEDASASIAGTTVYLRLSCASKGVCTLWYSADGDRFTPLGSAVTAVNDTWIGAKVGLFCNAEPGAAASGHIDVDSFLFQ